MGKDSGALKREHTSWFRESLMIEALSHVQRMDPDTFTRQVSAVIFYPVKCSLVLKTTDRTFYGLAGAINLCVIMGEHEIGKRLHIATR